MLKMKVDDESFERVIKQYDSLRSKDLHDIVVWKIVALMSILSFIVSLVIVNYALHLPQTELCVVSVNDIGEARYVGTTRGIKMDDYTMQESVIKDVLTRFLRNTYSIGKDNELMYENIQSNLYFLDSTKRKSYQNELKRNDPFKEVGRIKREVKIETIIPISPKSYQVDFFVRESEITGYGRKEKKMRAIFSVSQLTKDEYSRLTDKERTINPLGIYITDYSYTEVENYEK